MYPYSQRLPSRQGIRNCLNDETENPVKNANVKETNCKCHTVLDGTLAIKVLTRQNKFLDDIFLICCRKLI